MTSSDGHRYADKLTVGAFNSNDPALNIGDARIDGNLYVGGTSSLVGDVSMSGNCTVALNDLVQGNSQVNGTSLLKGNVTMSANCCVALNDLVKGNSQVNGTSLLKGDVTMSGNCSVALNDLVQGNSQVNGTSLLKGNVTMNNNLGVSGSSNLSGDVSMSGNCTVDNNLTVENNETVQGNLEVDGTSNLVGDVTMSGNCTVAGQLSANSITSSYFDVTTNLTLSGNLEVTGSTTLDGSLSVSGSSTMQNAHIEGNLTADGATIFNSDVSLTSGNLTVMGTTTLDNDLSLGGNTFAPQFNVSSFFDIFTDLTVQNGMNGATAMYVTASNGDTFIEGKLTLGSNTPSNQIVLQGQGQTSTMFDTDMTSLTLYKNASGRRMSANAVDNSLIMAIDAGNNLANSTVTINSVLNANGDVNLGGTVNFNADVEFNNPVHFNYASNTQFSDHVIVLKGIETFGTNLLEPLKLYNGGTSNTIEALDDTNITVFTVSAEGDINNSGNVTTEGNMTVSGNLTVLGNPILPNLTTISNLTVSTDLIVSGNATFDHNLHLLGNLCANTSKAVFGTICIDSSNFAVDTFGNVFANGNFYSNSASINYLTVNKGNFTLDQFGNVSTNGILQVNDAGFSVFANNNVSMAGNAFVSGSLSVVNDVTAENNLTVLNNLYANLLNINSGNCVIESDGDITTLGNATVTQNLTVSGSATLGSLSVTAGNFSIDQDGDVIIGGNCTVQQALLVNGSNFMVDQSGDVTMAGNCAVNGTCTILGDLLELGNTTLSSLFINTPNFSLNTTSGNMSSNGVVLMSNSFSSVGLSAFSGDFLVQTDNLSIYSSNGDMNMSGNCSINQNLTVNGTANLGSVNMNSGSFSGDLSVGGNLTVSQNSTLSSNLTVEGVTTLDGQTIMNGLVAINNVFTVYADSHLSNVTMNYLSVGGDSTLSGNLSVNNNSSTNLSGNLTVSGNSLMTHGLIISGIQPNSFDNVSLEVEGNTSLRGTLNIGDENNPYVHIDAFGNISANSINCLQSVSGGSMSSTGLISGGSLHITGTSNLDGLTHTSNIHVDNNISCATISSSGLATLDHVTIDNQNDVVSLQIDMVAGQTSSPISIYNEDLAHDVAHVSPDGKLYAYYNANLNVSPNYSSVIGRGITSYGPAYFQPYTQVDETALYVSQSNNATPTADILTVTNANYDTNYLRVDSSGVTHIQTLRVETSEVVVQSVSDTSLTLNGFIMSQCTGTNVLDAVDFTSANSAYNVNSSTPEFILSCPAPATNNPQNYPYQMRLAMVLDGTKIRMVGQYLDNNNANQTYGSWINAVNLFNYPDDNRLV